MGLSTQALRCRVLPGFLLLLASCGGAGTDPLSRPLPAGLDPFVRARVEAARAAAARGGPDAWLELAKTLDANGLREEALEAYGRCLTQPDADRATLEYLRGLALAALGRAPEALAAFDAALAAGDRYAPTHWRRAELLLDEGRLSDARAALESALALEPRSVPARLATARLDLLEGHPEAARARLEPLAEESPDERFVHGLLARAHRALGDEAAAARALAREERSRRISLSDPRAAEVATRATGILAALEQANELLLGDQAPQAVALLEPLRAGAPDDLPLAQMLGKALIAAHRSDEAIAVLQDAAQDHPGQFQLEHLLGRAYAEARAFGPAREHLLEARARNPAFGPIHADLGETELKLGHFPEAEAALARALECGEDALRTRLLLTQAQLQQGASGRALASAEAALAAYPNAVSAWTTLAEARHHAGLVAEARAALAEAERRNPRYERLPSVRALLSSEPGREGAPR